MDVCIHGFINDTCFAKTRPFDSDIANGFLYFEKLPGASLLRFALLH